jgi:enediyne biosynthesis protein E4
MLAGLQYLSFQGIVDSLAHWVICAFLLLPSPATPPANGIYPATQDHQPPAWFVDVAESAGVRMTDVNGGVQSKRYIIESTGSGVAILDYDNDGWFDIFFVNGTTLDDASQGTSSKPTSHLFHNNHDGTFTDVTEHAGLLGTTWGQGVCAGDYDNDGYDDLYVTAYGKNRLYHNAGDGTFKEVAGAAGVAGTGKEWGTGCAFVDFDRDGKLDLVVANYVHFNLAGTPAPGQASYCIWKGAPTFCGPRGLPSAPNLLYRNLGNGKFEDVSKSSGIQNTTGHHCFSVSTIDYDDDGWPDIYVACDSTPAQLYHNNHNSTFTDTAADAGVAFDEEGREQAGMGSTVADYDGDGRLDIFKTNFSDDTSTLYHNNGNGTFSDLTFQSGVGINPQDLGWGTMFMDIDNDGWPDLLVANGHVYPEVDDGKLGSTYREPRIVYHNLGNGKFQDISKTSGPGITVAAPSRGLAIGDLWNDGRLEAVVNNMNDHPMVLVNQAKNANHWLGVRLVGVQSNRDGIGARVKVNAGERIWVDEVRSGSSYDSNNDLRLHFGLGQRSKVEWIEVRWPTGRTETFEGGDADHLLTLREGSGHAKPQ